MTERETAMIEAVPLGTLLDLLEEAAEWIEEHGEMGHQSPWLVMRDGVREARRRLALPPGDAPPSCQWRETEDGQWETSCDRMWEFTNGVPDDNGVTYCHGCGKPVEAIPVVLVPAEENPK